MSRGPLDLAPWLYVTPAELAPFRDLLLRLGAREAFSAAQYAGVLAAMAKRAGGQPLDATTLAQAISIVQARTYAHDRASQPLWMDPNSAADVAITEQSCRASWPVTATMASLSCIHDDIVASFARCSHHSFDQELA